MLHEFAVDHPRGVEFVDGATQGLFGLEELLGKLFDPSGELAVRELRDNALGKELVGNEVNAFGLGQAVLERLDLADETVILSPRVLEFSPQRGPGHSGRGSEVVAKALAGLGDLEVTAGLQPVIQSARRLLRA